MTRRTQVQAVVRNTKQAANRLRRRWSPSRPSVARQLRTGLFAVPLVVLVGSTPVAARSPTTGLPVMPLQISWGELVDELFTQFEKWLIRIFDIRPFIADLTGTFTSLLWTPVPPQSRAMIPAPTKVSKPLFPDTIWFPILELNEFFMQISFIVISIYLLYHIGGVSVNLVEPSEFYRGIVKGTLAVILVTVNLQVLGILFAILRGFTKALIPNPTETFKAFFGTLAALVTLMQNGLGLGLSFVFVYLILLVFVAIVLASRLLVVMVLTATFPLVITSYLFASESDSAQKVYNKLLGFTLPTTIVVIPIALSFKMSITILSTIPEQAGKDLPGTEAGLLVTLLLGMSTLSIGLYVSIKSTQVGELAVDTSVKVAGAAAFGAAAYAIGGGTGLASGMRGRALGNSVTGLFSAGRIGARKTASPDRDGPMAQGLLERLGVESPEEEPDNIINGRDMMLPGTQYVNENPRSRNKFKWSHSKKVPDDGPATVTFDQEDDVFEIDGSSFGTKSWQEANPKEGKNVTIRAHPENHQETIIQPTGEGDYTNAADLMAGLDIDAEFNEDWNGFVTEDTLTRNDLTNMQVGTFGDPDTDATTHADRVFIDRNAIIDGNVHGSVPIRDDEELS